MKGKFKAAVIVISGDERQRSLAETLLMRGHEVSVSESAPADAISAVSGSDAVIFPRYLPCEVLHAVPGMVSSCGPDAVVFSWEHLDCPRRVYDLSCDEFFLWQNAKITAEGALFCAMKQLRRTIAGARVLVLGAGRVAECTADIFGSVGASVTIAARNTASLARASARGWSAVNINNVDLCGYDVIINTVPCRIINEDAVPAGTVLLELASPPYGFDLEHARSRNIIAERLPSLPAAYAPVSAASAIADVVERVMEGERS